jgi:RHS repeat-associated protein
MNDDMLIYEKSDPNRHSSSNIGNNYLFHGRTYEPEVGLYFYRHRYYLPRLGRFLQTDPMGYEDSLNLYQAFNQNPVNFTDPMGLTQLGPTCGAFLSGETYNREEERRRHAAQWRAIKLVSEGISNAAIQTFLIPAKYLTLPFRLTIGFDFNMGVNFTKSGSIFQFNIGKQKRLDIVKEQTVVLPLIESFNQIRYDIKSGNVDNLLRTGGAIYFNTLFWGSVSKLGPTRGQDTFLIRNRVLKNIEESRKARASSNFLEYAKWDEIYQSVEKLDFSTSPDKAVFYSGTGNRKLAIDFAERYGATPIDFTPGGQHLESLNLISKMSFARSDLIWMRASEKFSMGASGKITLFVRGSLANRIFRKVEEPTLKLNFNVTKWQYRGY